MASATNFCSSPDASCIHLVGLKCPCDSDVTGTVAQVFLSYAREDQQRVEPLVHLLESFGVAVFWDRRVPAGSSWRGVLSRELTAASCVVVAWSTHSITSEWVLEEADVGKERNQLMPFLLDRVAPPIGFRNCQAADLTSWSGEPDHGDARAFAVAVTERVTGKQYIQQLATGKRHTRRAWLWLGGGLVVVTVSTVAWLKLYHPTEVANTREQIVNQLECGKQGQPGCLKAIVSEIERTNAGRKIPEIKDALKGIAEYTKPDEAGQIDDTSFALSILDDDRIAMLFVRNPDAFAKIAKGTRTDTGCAFCALRNKRIAMLFVQNPNVVVDAFARIGEASESPALCVFDRNDDMLDRRSALFVQNPAAFVRIAEGVGKDSGGAFLALGDADIASLFVQNPTVVVDALSGIGRGAGRDEYYTFEAFSENVHAGSELVAKRLGALFVRNPDAFVNIAKGTGKEARWAFWALGTERISALFEQNPDVVVNALVDIASSAGKGAMSAFLVLGNERVSPLFAQNPARFVDIADRNEEKTADAFMAEK